MRLMGKARDWRQSMINDAEVLRSLKQTFAADTTERDAAQKASNNNTGAASSAADGVQIIKPHIVEHKDANNIIEYRIYGVRLPREFDVAQDGLE
jgi:hypothetical protein